MKALRRYFLEGLALVVPVGLTAFVLVWLFQNVDGVLGRFVHPVLGRPVPGLGIVLLVGLLVATGFVAEKVLGRNLVGRADRLLRRIPVARKVYGASSRIVRTVLGQERYVFQEVVLFEYPSPGIWSLGFVTGPVPGPVQEALGEEGATVYLPTAPNPMSGYLVMLPRTGLTPLDVTVEEAFTYVFSAGTVSVRSAQELLDRQGDRP